MSKPDNNGFEWDDISSDSQFVVGDVERTEVKKDKKTVKDDVGDYIYMNPVKTKKNKSGKKQQKSQRKKRKRTWKKVLLAIVCTLMALVLLTVGTTLFLIFKGKNELLISDIQISSPDGINATVQEDGEYIVYNGATYKYNKDVTTLLFMGIDKRDINGQNEQGTGGQADVIVMMALDLKNRKLTMVNVPRDTMTDVAIYSASGYYTGMKKQQICLSYAYGDGKKTSCNNTMASVRRIFYNIPVSTYYSLDLDGIAAMNDAVGGVDVVSPETINKFKEGQQYHLQGGDAESFVRDRVHDRAEANMLRMQRQQVYARSFMNTVMSGVRKNPSVAVDLFNESAPYSCTNLNAAKVMYLAQDIVLHGSLSAEIVTVPGKTTLNANEQAEFTVSEKEFFEQFLSVYYEKM